MSTVGDIAFRLLLKYGQSLVVCLLASALIFFATGLLSSGKQFFKLQFVQAVLRKCVETHQA